MGVNVITMFSNLGPFAKPKLGVFSLPPYMEGVPQMGDEFISRHSPEMITAKVVRMHYPRDS